MGQSRLLGEMVIEKIIEISYDGQIGGNHMPNCHHHDSTVHIQARGRSGEERKYEDWEWNEFGPSLWMR